MKNWILVLVLVAGIGFFFGNLAFAEYRGEMDNAPVQNQDMMMGGPGGKGGAGMMMKGMMHKDSLVATSDGGVVVLSGPRLLKYDKDLTLIQEVELPRGKGPGRPDAQAQTQASDQSEPVSVIQPEPVAAEPAVS